MLGFFTHRKRAEVQRLLTNRMNKSCLARINPGRRLATRSSFCEVVWMIPVDHRDQLDFESAFPAVGKDICPKGLALIHNEAFDYETVIVGLHDATGVSFLRCVVEHSTPIGYNFHQIGVNPEEVVTLSDRDIKILHGQFAPHEMAGAELVSTTNA